MSKTVLYVVGESVVSITLGVIGSLYLGKRFYEAKADEHVEADALELTKAAQSAAQMAQIAADNAQATAQNAQATAQNAQATAQNAQATAQNAASIANIAKASAQGAQTTANLDSLNDGVIITELPEE